MKLKKTQYVYFTSNEFMKVVNEILNKHVNKIQKSNNTRIHLKALKC